MNLITTSSDGPRLDIGKLAGMLERPPLYERSADYIWTEPHVSSRMLEFHLDPDRDIASHRHATIDMQVAWISAHLEGAGGPAGRTLLDIGCGPGLYCERFARAGFAVSGIDLNPASLEYARTSAVTAGLPITYTRANYVDLDAYHQYDVITLINRDFSALVPVERDRLLAAVRRALKPGGLFVFDAMSVECFARRGGYRTFSVSDGAGFWCDKPHLLVEERLSYPDAPEGPVDMEHQVVIASDGIVKDFRNWLTFYTNDGLAVLVEKAGLAVVDSNEFLGDDAYDEPGVNLGLVARNP